MATLQYPDKYHAAVLFVDNFSQDANLSEESKLLLYALRQQATIGPCNEPRPWGWNVVSNAKWQSWRQLGEMPAAEAMRLFVRTLEEEAPDWLTPQVFSAWEQEAIVKAAEAAAQPHVADNVSSSVEQTTAGEDAAAAAAAAAEDTSRNNTNAAAGTTAAAPAPAATKPSSSSSRNNRSVAEVVVEGSWVSPYISSERRPVPRYEQSLALAGNLLYVVGGSAGGRHLSDAWALNLENLTWSCISTGGGDAPALAGHAAVAWNGNVLVIGGRTKIPPTTRGSSNNPVESAIPVRMLGASTGKWSTLEPTASAHAGTVPGPRGAHTATLINGKVYIFGGEDGKRRPLGELWTLDLNTMEWDAPELAGVAPSPRSGHSACSFLNRYIIFFGGGTVATCYDDLAVFDTQTMQWLEPEVDGQAPPPRAGHAASILGNTLYVLGGGNNARGCADMYSLDLSQLSGTGGGGGVLQWTLVGNTPPEAAIASEGLGLATVPVAECLVTFGGYNGKYHNAVHVYRPEGGVVLGSTAGNGIGKSQSTSTGTASTATATTTSTTSTTTPEAAANAAAASVEANGGGGSASASFAAAGAGGGGVGSKEDSAKEAAALEVSLMRRQLDSATVALAAAERAAAEAREALAAEHQRSMQLEVEVAELRQRLMAMGDLERELARRKQSESGTNKGSGLWGFISGADAAAPEDE